MAPSGPVLNVGELDALLDFIQLLLDAGESGRQPEAFAQTPSQRWGPFGVAERSRELPPRVTHLLARYGWHRAGGPAAANAVADEVGEVLLAIGHKFTNNELHGALLAGAFFVDHNSHRVFSDEHSLVTLEQTSAFINGYVQSQPQRLMPGEHPDSTNRRFRSYQRRRFGYDISPRSPKVLYKRLPVQAQELVEAFADQMVFNSTDAAHAIAGNLAVAMGRPVDETITNQLELALATLTIWRDLGDFGHGVEAHPLLGVRTPANGALWDNASRIIQQSMAELAEAAHDASDPQLVQTPALTPVGSIQLDAQSLQALQQLDDYTSAFGAWIRMGAGVETPTADRLRQFDVGYTGRPSMVTSAQIIANLPPSAMKVVAHVDALIARQRDIDGIALELASALGDRNLAPRCRRTLETAASWLNGDISMLEKMKAPDKPADIDLTEHRIELEPFTVAKQRDAESLLDFGAAVTELVRFSQTLDGSGQTPSGWWVKFHRRTLAEGSKIPSPLTLLERLPEGSMRLLHHHGKLLTSEHYGDLTAAPRALAKALRRDEEEPCVRTLAVALSVGVIWTDLERISRGRRTDTLLGAEPGGARERYICGRAQAQLEWGLQELLHTDVVIGV